MNRYLLITYLYLVSVGLAAQPGESGIRHGQLDVQAQEWKAWDHDSGTWLSVEDFWLAYAERSGGLHWGYASHYPIYAKVKENDLIIIETVDGICLMKFFHQRWRRANDVQRWDRLFNEYSGCSNVHQFRQSLLIQSTAE